MAARTCRLCKGTFTPRNPRQVYCTSECRTLDKQRRVRFTGVDGEGVTLPDGTHHYQLLSIGDESITNTEPHLQWWEIFEFLHDYGTEHPEEVLVGFFLGYDFTNWVRTLPEERAAMLITDVGMAKRRRTVATHLPPFPVEMADPRKGRPKWEFDMLPGRRFKVRPKGGKWVQVCDTGPFWQTSFLKAIDPEKWPHPICTPEDYETIKEGKAKRATAQLDKDMMRYNVAENRVLGSLTAELNKAFTSIGVNLRADQWYGPGQAAQKWLTLQHVPTREDVYDAVPRWILEIAWSTYLGGWFEQFGHGHVGDAEENDINSAYPYVISRLPCLLHGKWTTGVSDPPAGLTMVHAQVLGSDPYIGAMPHRLKTGRIIRPHVTSGWHWFTEIQASIRAGLIDTYSVDRWIHYTPCTCAPPVRALLELYKRRLEVGKNSPEGIAMKLIYNSMYGKFAQNIGSPKYANPIYASLITSGCRTMILDAIASHPNRSRDVMMIATDGIYFSTPHPNLDVSPTKLGAWDKATKVNLTQFQPGLYWDDKARAAISVGDTPKLKSRGVNGMHLAPHIERIDSEFTAFTPDSTDWPSMEIPIPFTLTSAKLALARGKWETCGAIHTAEHRPDCTPDCKGGRKTISATPEPKRDITTLRFEQGVLRTSPYRYPRYWDTDHPLEESYPYVPKNHEETEFDQEGDVMTPIREALLG